MQSSRQKSNSPYQTHIFPFPQCPTSVHIGRKCQLHPFLNSLPLDRRHRHIFLLADLTPKQQLSLSQTIQFEHPCLSVSVLPSPTAQTTSLFLTHLASLNPTLQLQLQEQLKADIMPQYEKEVLEEFLMEELKWTRRKADKAVEQLGGFAGLRGWQGLGREEAQKVERLFKVAEEIRQRKAGNGVAKSQESRFR